MNTRSPYNFDLANKIETRLQDIQSGRDLTPPSQEHSGDTAPPSGAKAEAKSPRTIGGLPAEEFESLLASLEEKAALSGGFDPETIAGTEVSTSARMLLLTRLLPNCTTQAAGDRISWILKQNRRKTLITQLVNNGTLQQALQQSLPPADELGQWLRQLLRAEQPVTGLESLTRDQLLSLAHAVEALNGVPGLNYMPELSDIVRHLDTGRLLADYDILLLNGFFGREKELNDLQNFLEKPKIQPGWWEGILLTGMGGAGKSTLLAKFIRDQVTRKVCTVTVLDFDRPAISPEDTTWLEMELSRQVGQQYPDASGELSQLRKETRLSKSSADEYLVKSEHGSRSAFRGFSSIVGAIKQVLTDKNVAHLPFLLVLDTFEEVTQRNLTTRILSWLSEIGDRLYPITLKVIISGRLFDSALRDFQAFQLQQICVNELDANFARELLVNMGLNDKVADELVASGNVPLRPLELKLLARVILSDPDFSLQTLTDGLQTNNPSSQQLFVGIVYRRVLLRITDEVVRTLACPGLVLHYVTKDLIQQVLVPALKMAPLSDEQANNALNVLAGYEWLAHRETDGSVWHSRDIRRMMLKVMIAYEPEKTKDIHEHAIRYFLQKTLPNERGEAIYHMLMLVKDPQSVVPDKSEIISVLQFISAYLTELPKTAGVFLKYVQQGHIDYEELPWMPDKYRDEATDATGQFLCDNREWGRALMVVRSLKEDSLMIDKDWVVDTLVATGEWELFRQRFILEKMPFNPASLAIQSSIFFADGIIGANILSPEAFQQRTTDFFEKGIDLKDLDSQLNKLFLARMAFRIVSIHGKQDLQEDCIRTMRRVIEKVYSWKREAITAGVIRNFFLLNLAVRDASPVSYLIDLACLNPESAWLKSILEKRSGVEMDAMVEGLLKRVLAVVEDFSGGQRRTVEGLLSRIDDLRKDYKDDIRIMLRPELLNTEDLLRFTAVANAEFRDPCRFALLEAFTDAAGYRQLSGIITPLLTWDLEDLQEDAFASNMAMDAEHALENCIELIDRCGKLGSLLQAAAVAAPRAPKLHLVLTAYTDWEDAIKAAVTTRKPWDVLVERNFRAMKAINLMPGISSVSENSLPVASSVLENPLGRYRRMLNYGEQGTTMESAAAGDSPDLSDAGIKNILEQSSNDLHTLVTRYLGDTPALHEIADEMMMNGDLALRVLRDMDEKRLRQTPALLENLEVIVRVDGSRPSFMIRNGEVDRSTSPAGAWESILDASDEHLRQAISWVGRIDGPGSNHVGTGFLVQQDVIITSRRVLQSIANRNSDGSWIVRPDVSIDFGHEFGARTSVRRRAIKKVAFAGARFINDPIDHTKLDLAVLELETQTGSPDHTDFFTINMTPELVAPGATVYIIGYPGNPGPYEAPFTLLEQLFRGTFGCKRLAPGIVHASGISLPGSSIAHDATTLGDNSGSPVIFAGREKSVCVLHYGSSSAIPRENWGHNIALIMDEKNEQGLSLKDCLLTYNIIN